MPAISLRMRTRCDQTELRPENIFCSGKKVGMDRFFALFKEKQIISTQNGNKYELKSRITCPCKVSSLENFKKVELIKKIWTIVSVLISGFQIF